MTITMVRVVDANNNLVNLDVTVISPLGFRINTDVPASVAVGIPLQTVADAVAARVSALAATNAVGGRGNPGLSLGQVRDIARSLGSRI